MESKSNSASEEVTTEVEVEEGGSKAAGSSGEKLFEYFGWVHHLGVNSIGQEYCHLRFLQIKGKYAFMYKKDPHENPGTKPIRRGVVSHALMVEDLGRRRIDYDLELYVLGLFNGLDGTKKGEIACAEPGDVRTWMDAFDQAKEQADYDLLRGGTRQRLNTVDVLNLEGHRPRVRPGLQKLVRIGKGPEVLLRQTSDSSRSAKLDPYGEDVEDAIDTYNWKCVRTMNGIRFFEDAAESKKSKSFLVKSVGVVDGSSDAVFEAVLSLEQHRRCEWDVLTADIELVTTIDGHYDVIHGTYNPKYLSRWFSKTDFVFSRQWFRSQDGSYTILQAPAVHKNCPKKSGYQRIKIHPSTWEIRELESSRSSTKRCLVTQMLEIHCSFWDRWKIFRTSKFETTIPFALLCQVAGLKEYFSVHPVWNLDFSSTVACSTALNTSTDNIELSDVSDEFYDAIADGDLLEDEDSDNDDDNIEQPKRGKTKLKSISWSVAGLGIKRKPASIASRELDTTVPWVTIDVNQFTGSLNQSKDDADKNCWSSPTGKGFMVRGRTYAKDFAKIVGGEPLLKLIAVDWLKAEQAKDRVALHPKSLLQSDAGNKLPFVLVINLMVPANPNYNLVLYYGAEQPAREDSLLGKFVNGSNTFRDSRFKLIPRIVQGYWMVKRAVGAKACLLGRAVTCRYLRQDNFLEIDVDIGSSSVARSIISLVLGYVTSIVVDLAILIEGKEEEELPEYILGTVRLNCLKPESAVPF